ncbi:MAG: UDP-N-acetyl glucosamine 2-epimerase, partial [Flavitalea sp.]
HPSLYSDIFEDLGLKPPDVLLDAGSEDKIPALKNILSRGNYDAVVVYGDTNSTLWGARAAELSGIPIIHVEAGERSFNQEMPEENNRIITDRLSTIRFCVSDKSLINLEKEGLAHNSFVTGDIMKDLLMQKLSNPISRIINHPYYFASIHRNYTQQDHIKLLEIIHSMNDLEHPVIFSLHPSTRKILHKAGINIDNHTNIQFLEPVDYSASISYQFYSVAVLTDSGGIQREAYWMKKRCITLRKETEWTETLNGNWNQLVYDQPDLAKSLQFPLGTYDPELYGTGNACERISQIIKHKLKNGIDLCPNNHSTTHLHI